MTGETTVRVCVTNLFRSFGMTTVFGNPGSTELPMFRGLPADFRYVLGLQESIVVGMADGFAQATRGAALVNLHSAAGVGHALGNLFTAYKNQTPLVVTAGQQARPIMPYEPFLFAERATEFPRPYVKWACEPARAQDVPAAIARAYYVAMEPPHGPTFVSIPVDDWEQPCADVAPRRIAAGNPGDPALLSDIAHALSTARSPAFVVGAGLARDQALSETVALAERHQAPVWAAPMAARNGFPESHPLFAGFLKAGREAIVADLADHDLILVLGGPLSLYHVEGFGPHAPTTAQVFLIVDNHTLAAWAPVGAAVIADLKQAMSTLLDGPAPPHRPPPPARRRPVPLDGTVLTDAYLLERLARLRPEGSVIVEEAPSSRHAMHERLPIVDADGFYTCASGGLGHGLPAAVGVALGRPNDKVIALLGDGSSLYAIQGLWSAAQLGLPITFIIVNNRRYQALLEFGAHFGLNEVAGAHLPGVDFCALARGQGVQAARVERPEAVDEALRAALAAAGPFLLEVIVA